MEPAIPAVTAITARRAASSARSWRVLDRLVSAAMKRSNPPRIASSRRFPSAVVARLRPVVSWRRTASTSGTE